jgi:hypothetical protein
MFYAYNKKRRKKKMHTELSTEMEKIMFPWLPERAFPRVAKLMVNGGLNKEHFGSI